MVILFLALIRYVLNKCCRAPRHSGQSELFIILCVEHITVKIDYNLDSNPNCNRCVLPKAWDILVCGLRCIYNKKKK